MSSSDSMIENVVISEMAPSPSHLPLESPKQISAVNLRKYDDERQAVNGHQTVPSMALSLMNGFEFVNGSANKSLLLRDSPFFDPNFWKNDFEQRKQERKRHFTQNLTRIDVMDYAVMDSDDTMMREMKQRKNKNRKQT